MLGIDVHVGRGDFSLEARLSIPTPGVTAFFGASGAGKTTLAHTVTGLIRATGHITLDEEARLALETAAMGDPVGEEEV